MAMSERESESRPQGSVGRATATPDADAFDNGPPVSDDVE